MRYKIGISNATYSKNGTPTPRFNGPMVLLDYVSPKAAAAFRRMKTELDARHEALNEQLKKEQPFPLPFNRDAWEKRHARWLVLAKPIRQWERKAFIAIIRKYASK